ncbi:MAG: hypothetical protein ACR2QC_08645, partial [Gammaproteobacteria bacterium]
FAGMELKRFRLSPEWRILIKRLKVPPFRRKFILANAGTGISFAARRIRRHRRPKIYFAFGKKKLHFLEFSC